MTDPAQQSAPVTQTQAAAPASAPANPAPAAAPQQGMVQPQGTQPQGTAPAANPAQQQAADLQNLSTLLGQDGQQEGGEGEGMSNAPEHYEPFDAGNGLMADEETVGEFANIARQVGLSQEEAQNVFTSLMPTFESIGRKRMEGWTADWAKQSSVDKEFGGQNFQANLRVANTALKKFSTPEFTKLLQVTGLGNNPEVIRVFYRIGQQMTQDKGVTGGGAPQSLPKLYPNSDLV